MSSHKLRGFPSAAREKIAHTLVEMRWDLGHRSSLVLDLDLMMDIFFHHVMRYLLNTPSTFRGGDESVWEPF